MQMLIINIINSELSVDQIYFKQVNWVLKFSFWTSSMGGCLFKVDTFSHTFALSLFSINKMKKKKHWSSFIPDIYDVFLVGE